MRLERRQSCPCERGDSPGQASFGPENALRGPRDAFWWLVAKTHGNAS